MDTLIRIANVCWPKKYFLEDNTRQAIYSKSMRNFCANKDVDYALWSFRNMSIFTFLHVLLYKAHTHTIHIHIQYNTFILTNCAICFNRCFGLFSVVICYSFVYLCFSYWLWYVKCPGKTPMNIHKSHAFIYSDLRYAHVFLRFCYTFYVSFWILFSLEMSTHTNVLKYLFIYSCISALIWFT